MKILCISDVFYPRKGGTEVIFFEIFRRLAKRGFDITTVTPRIAGTKKFEEIEGIKIIRVKPANRLAFVFTCLSKSLQIAKNSDVIQTAVWLAGYPAALCKLIAKKPAVLMVNAHFDWEWFKLRDPLTAAFFAAAEELLVKMPFDKYCPLSRAQAQELEKDVDRSKIEVVYPGVDFDLFKPSRQKKSILGLNDNDFVYAFYGRYDPQKGVDILLKAAKIFSMKYPNSRLLIICPQYERIKQDIKKYGIENYVILKKGMPQNEIVKYLNAADVIVMPSRIESFGIVAAEASSLAKPVIASRIGSLSEIVIDGKSGFLVESNPQEIAQKLEALYNNPQLRRKMGRAGSSYVKKFSWDKAAKQYERIYEDLV